MKTETIAENAISLFLEYCDKHGHSEEVAQAMALNEVTEGAADFVVVEKTIHDELIAALEEAKLQIQYLHEKFTITGSGAQVLARIETALQKARG